MQSWQLGSVGWGCTEPVVWTTLGTTCERCQAGLEILVGLPKSYPGSRVCPIQTLLCCLPPFTALSPTNIRERERDRLAAYVYVRTTVHFWELGRNILFCPKKNQSRTLFLNSHATTYLPASLLFFQSCWSTRDHIGGLPGFPTQWWHLPQVRCQALFRPQVPCTPNLHCPIANSASTQSQQPV